MIVAAGCVFAPPTFASPVPLRADGKVIWQDADEHAHYEGVFSVEAIVDTSAMKGMAKIAEIAADVRYQRCSKKSGVCILEQVHVSIDP